MKKDTHPQYFNDAEIICSCGAKITVGSTEKGIHTEICAKCHPFYTGKQKLVDSEGRIQKFLDKEAKAK